MGKRGPAPVPTAILEARGSWKVNEREGEPAGEGAPAWPRNRKQSKAAKVYWDETLPMLMRMNTGKETDGETLACYCELVAAWDAAKSLKLKLKIFPNLNRVREQLGLSPSARTRIKVDGATKGESDKGKYFKDGPRLATG